jgi:CBS domain-containing protein
VRRHGEGYVDYVWQWPGDPRHVGPKESYVRGFTPWGWVIGTGIYLDDVEREIARIEKGIVKAAAGISLLMVLLLVNMVRYSHAIERERSRAMDELGETTERYRQLIEATTEGTLLVVDDRCRYANPRLLTWLGYTAAECALLALGDILPASSANAEAWAAAKKAVRGEPTPPGCSGELRRRDGGTTRCALSFAPVAAGTRGGLVLVAHDPARSAGPDDAQSATDDAHPAGSLLEHLPCGAFSARLDRRGTLVSRNPAAARWLRPPADGGEPALASLFGLQGAWDAFVDALRQTGMATARVPVPVEGASIATLDLRASLIRDTAGNPVSVVGVVEDVTAAEGHERERDALVERLQTPLLFLHQRVGALMVTGQLLPPELPVHKAAAWMSQRRQSAALVGSAPGSVAGIVTLRDLCDRVVAERRDSGVPLREVMTVPVSTVPANAPVYEALLCMHEHHVHHLGVVAEDGNIAGLVSDRDLLPFQNYGTTVLTREIARATFVEDVVRGCRRTPHIVRALLDSGALPRNVTRLVASVCDAATERFVELAIEELGPPPGRFAFLALGSQSRHEQTLATDQDNAIVYVPAADEDASAAYFLELGKRVCGWLTQAGYQPCHGHVMASNRIWCRTVKAWKTHYRYWISSAEPEELQLFSMCFDFRAVAGDAALEKELREGIQSALVEAREFFAHFARHALQFKPPVVLLGRVFAVAGREKRRGVLDLKDAMLPVVSFARLYALRYDIDRTHTLERIDALVERGLLPAATRDEIAVAYEFLMRLRLREQSRALQEAGAPDNLLPLRRLGYAEKAMLRQAFAQIRAIQARIGYDFLGGIQQAGQG